MRNIVTINPRFCVLDSVWATIFKIKNGKISCDYLIKISQDNIEKKYRSEALKGHDIETALNWNSAKYVEINGNITVQKIKNAFPEFFI